MYVTIDINGCIHGSDCAGDGGLEIANTDIALQRLNKLTYKVRSQSDPNTWYIVARNYSDGWMCECPDFAFRHLECKHVHAVKFSKLLRKKIYQDTFAQLVNNREYR